MDVETLAFLLTSALFLMGFIGSFLPFLPGTFLIWAGIILHYLWVPQVSVSGLFLILATLALGLTFVIDFLLSLWGARRFGASAKGLLGAVIGGIVGLFIPPPLLWVILGPFIGAFAFEFLSGRGFAAASTASIGTVLGTFIAYFAKIGINLGLIVAFLGQVWPSVHLVP